MNLREVKRCFEAARKPGTNLSPIVDCKIEIKAKSKDGLYYTAETRHVKCELEKERQCEFAPNNEALEGYIEGAARRGVFHVFAQMSSEGGWWFEGCTVWLGKDEVGIIFADFSLIRQDTPKVVTSLN